MIRYRSIFDGRTYRADHCGPQPVGLLSFYVVYSGNWGAARLRCCEQSAALASLPLLQILSRLQRHQSSQDGNQTDLIPGRNQPTR
jgi:hypothetical protein